MTLEEWRAACPLRKWIEKQKSSHGAITRLSVALGVHRATIDVWTRGIQPRLAHLQKLEAETGIKVSSWMRWLTKKPPEQTDAAE